MPELIEAGNIKPRKRIIADGIETVYYFDFFIFNIQDLNIYINDILLTSGYSINLKPDIKGGSIIFATPPEAGTIITIFRNLPLKRTTNFKEVGPFMSSKVNYEFDYQLACIEQLEETIGRTVTFPPYAPTQLNVSLPLPQAGKAIIWSEQENSLQNSAFKLQDLDKHISNTLEASKESLEVLAKNQEYLEEVRNTKEELRDIKPYIDEQIISKTNTNADNITAAGIQTITGFGMPDYTSGLLINNTVFTSPKNGYIYIAAQNGQIIKPHLNRNGIEINLFDTGTNFQDVICLLFPTKQGDIWNNLLNNNQSKFFPCIGG